MVYFKCVARKIKINNFDEKHVKQLRGKVIEKSCNY
jgi:hypothetical protein